jgi:hypothetical protein
MLKPFLSETAKSSSTTSEKLLFHMAVMRWKCSLLSPDERAELNSWIDHQKKSKEAARTLPWSVEAGEHGDDLFAENSYVQRLVSAPFVDSGH